MPMRTVALLLILAALWGGSFVFIRVAVPDVGPIPLAFARVALAAAALLALAVAQQRMPDIRARWREFAVVGIVNSALPFVLFCYAGLYVTASAAAILNATSPLFLDEELTINMLAAGALIVAGTTLAVRN